MGLLLRQTGLPVVDTATAGATLELQGVTIRVLEPLSEPRVSQRYPFHEMIKDYGNLLTRPGRRRHADALTIADRIYGWPLNKDRKLDQLRRVREELKRDATSRRAIIQLWNPAEDLATGPATNPSGHCLVHFTLREGALQTTLVSRSVDAWNACLPNMLAFVGLQETLAGQLGATVGIYTQFIISFHIYIRDLPSVTLALQGCW